MSKASLLKQTASTSLYSLSKSKPMTLETPSGSIRITRTVPLVIKESYEAIENYVLSNRIAYSETVVIKAYNVA